MEGPSVVSLPPALFWPTLHPIPCPHALIKPLQSIVSGTLTHLAPTSACYLGPRLLPGCSPFSLTCPSHSWPGDLLTCLTFGLVAGREGEAGCGKWEACCLVGAETSPSSQNRSSHQPLTVKRGPFLQVLKVQANGGWVEVLRFITQMLLLHGSPAGAPTLAQQTRLG